MTQNTIIQIKRSTANAAPNTLAFGELAYSFTANTLYIGDANSVPVQVGATSKVAGEAYDAANSAANTVSVYQDGSNPLYAQHLNFVNTSSIVVTVVPGTGPSSGNANISFNYIGAVQGTTGSQGTQGTFGVQGATGTQGLDGVQGTFGTQGTQGIQGTLGNQGVTGALKAWSLKTGPYTAVDGDRIIADTSAGPFAITLPASPTSGAYVQITDGNQWSANNLTINRNGSTIETIADNMYIDITGITVEFIFNGSPSINTWEVTATTGARGVQGTTGAGSQGVQGTQGAGTAGTQGLQGTQGAGTAGTQGVQGQAGTSQGTIGSQGMQGVQGATGTGTQGTQGTTGSQGRQGTQGATGAGTQGTQGAGTAGTQGTQGATGAGTQGAQGTFGSIGTQGVQGLTGAGTQGTQGTVGSQGSQGVQGEKGTQGVQGTLGTTGSQGVQGTLGTTGSQGVQGLTGAGTQGLTGTGSQGTQGTLGTTGSQGTQGVQGEKGTQGSQGTLGTIGTQGTQGLTGTGSQGTQGTVGNTGTQGTQGLTGSGTQGTQGLTGTGSQGVQGLTGSGSQGVQGTLGSTGSQGTQGLTGAGSQGTQGAGSVGTQGTQGTTGSQGLIGTQGSQGVQGLTGSGTQGSQGLTGTGSQGVQGTLGTTGSQGTQGLTGTGTQGVQGTLGTTGSQGTQGTVGNTGTQGTQGTLGTTGSQGVQGLTGSGTQGTQGVTGSGTQGTQGATGAGSQGTQGLTGTGSQGIQGTLGTTGTQGTQGIIGTTGTQGVQGLTGTGTQGTQGLTGAGTQGTQGLIGTGSQGVQGLVGSGSQGVQGTVGTVGPSGNVVPYTDATGTDTITATYSPALTSYYDGLYVLLDSAGNNTTTTPTFNPNGLGAKTITRDDGTPLVLGDTGPSGYVMHLVYNSNAGGTWRLVNPEIADASGNTNEIQINSGGVLVGYPDFIFDTGNNILQIGKTGSSLNTSINLFKANTQPPTPAANTLTIFGRSIAGRVIPAWVGPSGLDSPVQPFFGRNHIGYMHWTGNGTAAANTIGILPPTMAGTATARTVLATNLFQSLRRIGYLSTAVAGGSASLRVATASWLRGNTDGQGGFTFVSRFGISDPAPVTNATMLIGMSATTTALSNTNNPLTIQNFIGIGQVPNSNNLSIIGNATNTSALVIDTGLRCNVGNVNVWDFSMFAAPNSNTIGIQIMDMTNPTLNTYSTVLANTGVNMPFGNTLLTVQQFRTNNSAAQVVGLDFISLYIETDL